MSESFTPFEYIKSYAIWHLIWEYGHTLIGIFVLPLTDPWIRKVFGYLGWAPKEALDKRLTPEAVGTLIGRIANTVESYNTNSEALLRRLNNLDDTVGKGISKFNQSTENLTQALDTYSKNFNHNASTLDSCITNSQALLERLKDLDNTVDRAITNSQALLKRLNNLDDAIEIRVNQVNKATERYITTIDSSTQKASNKFSSDQQALTKRLQEYGIHVEEESVEEVLCKCLDRLEEATGRINKYDECSQHLKDLVGKAEQILKDD